MSTTQHGQPALNRNEPTARRRRRGLGKWFTSFGGILASVATIVAAVSSVLAAHQTSRVSELTIIVRQQQEQLKAAQHSAATKPVSSTSPSTGALPGGGTYLSALQPTVDHGEFDPGAQVMSATPYPNSVTFFCQGPQGSDVPDEAFDVAGHTTFTAVVGIPDDTSNVTGLDETVSIADQNGNALGSPVTVSLGHTVPVRLNISGVTQLTFTCSGTNAQTDQSQDGYVVTLGNAAIS